MVLVASYDLLDLLGGLFADVRKLVQLSAAWLVVNTGPGGSGGMNGVGRTSRLLGTSSHKMVLEDSCYFCHRHFYPMFLLYPISW